MPLSTPPARAIRYRLLRSGAGLCLAAAVLLGACADDPEPDPAEARRERVETRLRTTFSGVQSSCILDALDDSLLEALDRTTDLEAGSPEMAVYSQAVAHCVTDPDGTTTTVAPTTTAAPTTTEAGSEADEEPTPDPTGDDAPEG